MSCQCFGEGLCVATHFVIEESFRSEKFFEVLISSITTASKRFVFPGPLTVYKFFKLKLLVIQYTLHILIITEIFGVQLTLTYAHRCNLSSSTYIHMYVLYVCASLCFAIFFWRHPYIWSATILHSIVYVFHAHTPAYLVCSSQL